MTEITATLRPLPARPETEPLLRPHLLTAVNWLDIAPQLGPEAIDADETLAGYVTDFGRAGDLAVAAVVGEDTVGAAWLRLPTEAWSGHGRVADDIPELMLAVAPAHRGAGLGSSLLSAIIGMARMAGHPSLSASLADGNEAQILYTRAGFRPVGRSGAADTLLLGLCRD